MRAGANRLRVVLLSSTQFGRACLERGLLGTPGVEVAGILTTPPEITISYSDAPVRLSTHARFDDLAGRIGCEVACLSGRVRTDDYLAPLRRWKPDLLVALGWYYLVGADVRAAAREGCVGIHASLLPRYRGNAPIPWAIIRGETETGVTLLHLEREVDAGDVVGQHRIAIGPDDTVATVYARATDASCALLRRMLPLMRQGRAPRVPQGAAGEPPLPARAPHDGRIDWNRPARALHDWVRAQTRPYPGAFTDVAGTRLHVWAARPVPGPPAAPPGTVLPGSEVRVACADGSVTLLDASHDGRALSPAELRALLPAGTHLGARAPASA